MEKLKKYNPDRRAYVAHELLDKYRFNLSLHAQKLLFALAQNLDNTADLFPTWEIDIRGVFQYLNLSEDNNDRYAIVRDAFMEISKNPIEWRISDKKWGSIPWHKIMSFDADKSNYIRFEFNELAKPFLLELKQFVQLKTSDYIKLPTPYSMWLYPHLKDHVKMGWHEMTIERLKEITYNEKTDSYNPNKNKSANKDFIRWVIGIESVKGSKKWECLKNKEGEAVGTLAEINKHTDLNVIAKVKKDGKRFYSVYFEIKMKSEAAKKEKVRYAKRNNTVEVETEKGIEIRIPMSAVAAHAASSKMTKEEYLSKSGYIQKGEYAVKRENKRSKEKDLFSIIKQNTK